MSETEQALENTRKRFEERMFARHFMSTIRAGSPFMTIDETESLTLQELCEKEEDGTYKRPEMSAMWFGWQSAISEYITP